MKNFSRALFHDPLFGVCLGLFLLFIVWRIVLIFFVSASDADIWFTTWYSFWWGGSYQLIALVGAIFGFMVSRKWGGLKSVMGRATFMFSVGLLGQWFAQAAGTYLVWQVGTVPYPSLSDIGAFGAIIFYAIGAVYIAKASGARVSLRSYKGKLIAIIVPILFLIFSFTVFLRSYEYDWSSPITTFLDLGYPLGAAFYVSLAILAYFLSLKFLGGIMKLPILFLIASLVTEYIADFLFLYDAHAGSYIPGGFNDMLFVIAYSLMAISLTQIGVVFNRIKET